MAHDGDFFSELRRRNVFRVAGLYLVVAWLMVQVAGTVLPMFGAPPWLARSLVLILAIGFFPALVFAWVFELTPDGLRRDTDSSGQAAFGGQTVRRLNRAIVAILVLALTYFGFDKFFLAPKREAAIAAAAAQAVEKSSVTNATIPVIADKSIAVLPLENTGHDPANAAMHLQRANGRHDDRRVRPQP